MNAAQLLLTTVIIHVTADLILLTYNGLVVNAVEQKVGLQKKKNKIPSLSPLDSATCTV